jgi:hypothetical protein
MVPKNSLLVTLAQQGVEAAGNIIAAAPSVRNHRGEPFVGNRCLADNDARWWITQNHRRREYSSDRDDLRNIIDNRRCNRARLPSPHWRSPVRVATPSRWGVFHTLAPGFRQVAWPNKFKPRPIDKYDGSSNPEEFIQVYHMVIEATGGDDLIKANYLPTTLTDTTRLWLINLPEGTIYDWD